MPAAAQDRTQESIAEAVLDLVADGGLDQVSIRTVAARAGVSVGMVQRRFRTKDELMRFAMQRVRAAITARMDDEGRRDTRDTFRALFDQTVPATPSRHREARIALAFLGYVAVRPEAGAELRAETALLRDHLGAGVDGADPGAAVTGLLAVVDGLGLQVVTGQLGADAARGAFETVLARVLPPGPESDRPAPPDAGC